MIGPFRETVDVGSLGLKELQLLNIFETPAPLRAFRASKTSKESCYQKTFM